MNDLRNFHGMNDSDMGGARMELSVYAPGIACAEIGDHAEPLGAFHTGEVEETGNTGRIVGGLAIALMLGAAAVYGYEASNSPQSSKPAITQTAANNPAPAPFTAPPQAQSADDQAARSAPADALIAPAAPSQIAPAAPAPVQKAPLRSARAAARADKSAATVTSGAPAVSSGVPEQNAAVQPVYPTAPASSLVNNNNLPVITPDVQEPAAPVFPVVTPAPSASAQPVPDQAAQPAPAPAPDPSGQPAQ